MDTIVKHGEASKELTMLRESLSHMMHAHHALRRAFGSQRSNASIELDCAMDALDVAERLVKSRMYELEEKMKAL